MIGQFLMLKAYYIYRRQGLKLNSKHFGHNHSQELSYVFYCDWPIT